MQHQTASAEGAADICPNLRDLQYLSILLIFSIFVIINIFIFKVCSIDLHK